MYFSKPKHQKWALSGLLLLALSTSITFPQKYQSLDLAQEAAEGAPKNSKVLPPPVSPPSALPLPVSQAPVSKSSKIGEGQIYLNGEYKKVVYTKEDGKTSAQIACECDLGKKPIILSENSNDIITLANALNAQIKKDAEEKEKAEKAAKEKELSTLQKIEKKCLEQEDTIEKLECRVDGFTELLSKQGGKNAVTVTPGEALAYYKENISRLIISQMSNLSESESPESIAQIISDLIENTPKNYSKIRDELIKDQKRIINKQAETVRQTARQNTYAQQFKGTPYGDFLSRQSDQQFMQEMNVLMSLASLNRNGLYSGLDGAVLNDYLTPKAASSIFSNYSMWSNQLLAGLINETTYNPALNRINQNNSQVVNGQIIGNQYPGQQQIYNPPQVGIPSPQIPMPGAPQGTLVRKAL